VKEISDLWRDTFAALHPLMKEGGRIVCVWPSFKSSHGVARVDLSADPDLPKRFQNRGPARGLGPSQDPLLYHRAFQRIMRRIVILERMA